VLEAAESWRQENGSLHSDIEFAIQALRALDPHRPRYHFSPDNWMNDPIPFFRDGEYHIFFQHNPNGAFWGTMHWGHARSRDLVHWELLPIALAPTPGGPDQDGCFTGCVVRGGDRFHILYTGIPQRTPLRQVQCLAGSDDLITWEKYAGNPVIAQPPEGFGECFRDPQTWREGDTWYMIIGSEQPEGKGGAALLYRASSLTDWQCLHPLFLGDAAVTGRDFECPDFFPLGEKYVLITSRGATHWHAGSYADQRFTLEKRGVTDGGAFYAAKTLSDGQGRRILFGWITERRPGDAQRQAGWSGVLSLPRVLTLLPDGALGMEPVPELQALRGAHRRFTDLSLAGDDEFVLEGVQGDALEILIRFAPTGAKLYGVRARRAQDGTEFAEIAYNREANRLVDAPLILREGEGLALRLFVDRSVIEAFANGRACQTLRFYPERSDCLGISLFARGGRAEVLSVDVWEML
jgi:beta-fructofuranosidase